MTTEKEYNIDCYFDVDFNYKVKYEMVGHSKDINLMISYIYDWVDEFEEINCVLIFDEYHDELLAVIHFDINGEDKIYIY